MTSVHILFKKNNSRSCKLAVPVLYAKLFHGVFHVWNFPWKFHGIGIPREILHVISIELHGIPWKFDGVFHWNPLGYRRRGGYISEGQGQRSRSVGEVCALLNLSSSCIIILYCTAVLLLPLWWTKVNIIVLLTYLLTYFIRCTAMFVGRHRRISVVV